MQKLVSTEHTSSKRVVKDGKVYWNNVAGTKQSQDVNVTQMNVKDLKTGEHMFYNPKSGVQGVAGGNRDKKK